MAFLSSSFFTTPYGLRDLKRKIVYVPLVGRVGGKRDPGRNWLADYEADYSVLRKQRAGRGQKKEGRKQKAEGWERRCEADDAIAGMGASRWDGG